MLGEQFLPEFGGDFVDVEVLGDLDCLVDPLKFGLVGGEVGDVVEQFVADGVVSTSAVQDHHLPQSVRVLSRHQHELHRDFLLQKQVVGLLDDLPEVRVQLSQTVECHIGTPMDDDGVLSLLVHVDVGHACGLILQQFPVQLHMSGLHLGLEALHGVVVAGLPDEGAAACEFAGGDCLVGALAAVGSHVAQGLDGLSAGGDLLDVEEVVGVGTAENTDLLVLHGGYVQFIIYAHSSNCLRGQSEVRRQRPPQRQVIFKLLHNDYVKVSRSSQSLAAQTHLLVPAAPTVETHPAQQACAQLFLGTAWAVAGAERLRKYEMLGREREVGAAVVELLILLLTGVQVAVAVRIHHPHLALQRLDVLPVLVVGEDEFAAAQVRPLLLLDDGVVPAEVPGHQEEGELDVGGLGDGHDLPDGLAVLPCLPEVDVVAWRVESVPEAQIVDEAGWEGKYVSCWSFSRQQSMIWLRLSSCESILLSIISARYLFLQSQMRKRFANRNIRSVLQRRRRERQYPLRGPRHFGESGEQIGGPSSGLGEGLVAEFGVDLQEPVEFAGEFNGFGVTVGETLLEAAIPAHVHELLLAVAAHLLLHLLHEPLHPAHHFPQSAPLQLSHPAPQFLPNAVDLLGDHLSQLVVRQFVQSLDVLALMLFVVRDIVGEDWAFAADAVAEFFWNFLVGGGGERGVAGGSGGVAVEMLMVGGGGVEAGGVVVGVVESGAVCGGRTLLPLGTLSEVQELFAPTRLSLQRYTTLFSPCACFSPQLLLADIQGIDASVLLLQLQLLRLGLGLGEVVGRVEIAEAVADSVVFVDCPHVLHDEVGVDAVDGVLRNHTLIQVAGQSLLRVR